MPFTWATAIHDLSSTNPLVALMASNGSEFVGRLFARSLTLGVG